MKSKFNLLIPIIITVFLPINISFSQDFADPSLEEIKAVAVNILIDGKPTEWGNVPILIKDKKGDMHNTRGDHYSYDVVTIKMTADSEYVYILVELADEVGRCLQKNAEQDTLGDVLGTISIDVDNNKNTGIPKENNVFINYQPGFDVQVSMAEGHHYRPGSEFICYDIGRFNKKFEKGYETGVLSNTTRDNVEEITFSENFLEMRIPQELMNIKKGQKVRVIFFDFNEGEYSEEIIRQIW